MKKKLLLVSWLFCSLNISLAQNGKISGTVTDIRDNTPIQNATVKIKGGSATTTSSDGSFNLASAKSDVTLEITSIGYASKIVKARIGESVSVPLVVDLR
ncbi:MAG: carboxypeptidase regulatory-like domain-containing protein, partial [Ginsengibacter sp.]